jgi:hypothetical protein
MFNHISIVGGWCENPNHGGRTTLSLFIVVHASIHPCIHSWLQIGGLPGRFEVE